MWRESCFKALSDPCYDTILSQATLTIPPLCCTDNWSGPMSWYHYIYILGRHINSNKNTEKPTK